MDKLQGTWRIEASFWNGIAEPDDAKNITILFEGDKVVSVDKDGTRLPADTIRLMPERNPKAIDWWNKGRGEAAPGIYLLDGDMFRWCSAGGNNKVRPTAFTSEPGSKQKLLVLRRQRT